MDKEVKVIRISLASIGMMRPQIFKRIPKESAPTPEQASLMLESGGYLQLESGGKVILESISH